MFSVRRPVPCWVLPPQRLPVWHRVPQHPQRGVRLEAFHHSQAGCCWFYSYSYSYSYSYLILILPSFFLFLCCYFRFCWAFKTCSTLLTPTAPPKLRLTLFLCMLIFVFLWVCLTCVCSDKTRQNTPKEFVSKPFNMSPKSNVKL